MTPKPLCCHRCGSAELALNEVIHEHARYQEGLFIDESGAIRARGEATFSPGDPQPRLTEIECLSCGHFWHPVPLIHGVRWHDLGF